MKKPNLSKHFQRRLPSSIRKAQIAFDKRKDKNLINVINLSIGNVSLPMYPAMQERMKKLGKTVFSDGVVPYTPSAGTKETRKAFLNILEASGMDSSNLFVNITDGGSSAMELMLLGVSGPSSLRPIVLLDPAYTNYIEFSKRLNVPIVTTERKINDDGSFKKLDLNNLKHIIELNNPTAVLVIPYDNPTGQFLSQNELDEIAKICVEYGLWLVSDEAYRPLCYKKNNFSSIWKISKQNIPGIKGYRISIESASKVWNACGLRIGGIITDNEKFHIKAISEYTANLCANTLGQNIFGVLAYESHEKIQSLFFFKENLENEIPGLIVTQPEAAIYCVIDFKNICNDEFDVEHFVHYCATQGKVRLDNILYTLLLAPMTGFYSNPKLGKTQLRLSIVESPELMRKSPKILSKLYKSYLK